MSKFFVLMVGTLGIRIDGQHDLMEEVRVFDEVRKSGKYYLALNRATLGDNKVADKLLKLNVISLDNIKQLNNMSSADFLDYLATKLDR